MNPAHPRLRNRAEKLKRRSRAWNRPICLPSRCRGRGRSSRSCSHLADSEQVFADRIKRVIAEETRHSWPSTRTKWFSRFALRRAIGPACAATLDRADVRQFCARVKSLPDTAFLAMERTAKQGQLPLGRLSEKAKAHLAPSLEIHRR